MKMIHELKLTTLHILKLLPGRIGCKLRAKLLPISIGKNSFLWDGVHIDEPKKLMVGNNTSINRGCILNCGGGITIGNDVLIGPNTIVYSQNHNFLDRNSLIRLQGYSKKSVTIGHNVWIAASVIILPGVSIGDGAVIGAGSVVTKDIPQNSVAVGNPARIVSQR